MTQEVVGSRSRTRIINAGPCEGEVTETSSVYTGPDCRGAVDRRSFSWKTVVFGFLRSRRRGQRRLVDPEPQFVDWHHPWLLLMSVGIMLLSVVDAFMTLQLIARGAVEVNPVMAAAMGGGTQAFAISKMLLTGTGILALVFLARSKLFNCIRASLTLTAFFSFYCCLVCYEVVLLLNLL